MTLTQNGIDYICQNFGSPQKCVVSAGLWWEWEDIDGNTDTETGGTGQVLSRLIIPQLIVKVTMLTPARGEYYYSDLRTANGGNDVTFNDIDTVMLHDENSGDQWCYSAPPPPCSSYITQPTCELAGCYWYNNACHSDPYIPVCSDYASQSVCEANNCYWCNGQCQSTPCGIVCSDFTDQTSCETAGCYWYKKFIWEQESCHSQPLDPMEQYLIYGGIGAAGIAVIVLLARR